MRLALHAGQEHPELSFRREAWLALIAHRLGIIAQRLQGPRRRGRARVDLGEPLPPLGTEYLEEILQFALFEAKETDDPDSVDQD